MAVFRHSKLNPVGAAQGIEAFGRDLGRDAKHESPVPEGDAPMKKVRISKGRNTLLLDRNGDLGFIKQSIDGAGIAMMLDPGELRRLSKAAWYLAVEIEKEG